MENKKEFAALLTHWHETGAVPEERTPELETALTSNTEHPQSPWFIRIAMAVSAWVAAGFFIAALLAWFVAEEILWLWGIGFMLLGLGIHYWKKDNDFTDQLGLVFTLTGEIMFAIGLINEIDNDNLRWLFLIMILLQLVLLIVNRDMILRFISTVGALGISLAWLFFEHYEQDWTIEISLILFILLLASGVLVFWENETKLIAHPFFNSWLLPVGYALSTFFLGMVTFFIDEFLREELLPTYWVLLPIGLCALLLGYEYLLFKRHHETLPLGFMLITMASTVLIATLARETPGLLAALLIILLSFEKRRNLLFWLAQVFLAGFIIFYYYSLSLTLLNKSYILVGSGLIFLALWGGLNYRANKPSAETQGQS